MRREALEVVAVTRDDDRVRQRGRCHHDRVNCELGINVLRPGKRNARRLGYVDGGYDLAGREDLLTRVGPSTWNTSTRSSPAAER